MGIKNQTHDDDRGEQNQAHNLIVESHRDDFETAVELAESVSIIEHTSFRPERWIVVTDEHVVMQFDCESGVYKTSALDGDLAWVDDSFEPVFVEFFQRLDSNQIERDYNPSMEETTESEAQRRRKDEIVDYIDSMTQCPLAMDSVADSRIIEHMCSLGYEEDVIEYDLQAMSRDGDRIYEPKRNFYATLNQGDSQ